MSKAVANMILTVIVFALLISVVFAGVSAVAPIGELHQMQMRGESGWTVK